LKRAVKRHHRNNRHRVLFKLFPAIHRSLGKRETYLLDEWRAYCGQYPNGYRYSQFTNLYTQWLAANQLLKPPKIRWAVTIEPEDASWGQLGVNLCRSDPASSLSNLGP
jgi:hypothetical protein